MTSRSQRRGVDVHGSGRTPESAPPALHVWERSPRLAHLYVLPESAHFSGHFCLCTSGDDLDFCAPACAHLGALPPESVRLCASTWERPEAPRPPPRPGEPLPSEPRRGRVAEHHPALSGSQIAAGAASLVEGAAARKDFGSL